MVKLAPQKATSMTVFYWLLLNIIVAITMDLALFMQTTPAMKKAGFLKKLGVSELWATLEWVALIPAQRLGNRFLTAPQLALTSYVFDFLGQIGSNALWLKLPTTIDDYVAMIVILAGMANSKYRWLG